MWELEQNSLKKLLFSLVKQAKLDLEKRFKKAKTGITPLQYGTLLTLKAKAATINELSKKMIMRPPSLVPVIDALEKQQLLTRKIDASDRRKIQLTITKKGAELLSKIPFDDKSDSLNIAFNKLSSSKQKTLLNLLEELTTNFI